ncbi:MAG: lipopolysaccharide biosynthesis protein [Novosphingobium sp. 12-64-8]|nr:MAG: lipopolysaccharide biosynthesis protein [Novosphingobium sp. 12-64-8]
MNTAVASYRGSPGTVPALPFDTRVPPPAADRIDLRLLLAVFRRRIGVFLAVLLAVLAGAAVLTTMQERTYIAKAEVTLNSRLQNIAPTSTNDRQQDQAAIPSEGFVDTQVAVMTSQANVATVVDTLGLARDPRFAAGASPAEARLAAIEYVRGGVTAERIGTTYGIAVSFESTDPAESAKVANAFATQYTLGALERKKSEARQTSAAISGRLDQLRGQALADTAAAQRYRIAHNLLTTTQGTLTEQEISAYNQQVTLARAQAAEDTARLDASRRQLAAGGAAAGVDEGNASPSIAGMRGLLGEATSQLASLTARYGPLHPDVIRAKAQVDAIQGQIAGETRRVISTLETRARASTQRLNSLAGSLDQSRGALETNNAATVGLQDLEKRAETSNALYESYLNRFKELTAREGTEQADADMLHPADVPTQPDSPHVLLNLILALALGTGLGVAAAFAAEMTFSGLTTGDDIEQRLGVRYLGSIPALQSLTRSGNKSPTTALLDDPRSAFAESFRSLRASIAMNTTEAKVIAITSALPDEGKTTTSICLARSMAASGDAVLLLDCDLRRQGVSIVLRGDTSRPGLLEVLRGTATLDEALVIDPATGLSILPLAAGTPDDANDAPELLTGAEMDRLLAVARERFDAVILDTAPVLPIADARLVLGKADASVFVVRWRKTPEAALRSALRLLPDDRVQLAGVALTRVDMRKQSRFGYGDDAFYHAYKSYYA